MHRMGTNGQSVSRRGLVVSDLHLFAKRSIGFDRIAALNKDLKELDVLVLNGDIFDFKWSVVGDERATLISVLEWLRKLTADYARCAVHFVLGNHDCIPALKAGLTDLAAKEPRFYWHEFALRLGPKLFFHGDCVHRRMNHHGLLRYRDAWQVNRQPSSLRTSAYRCIDKLRITHFVHERQFPRRKTIERAAYYLDDAHPGWREKTSDCYFGHTHLPFSDCEHEGVIYHNTGSAIVAMEFNPVFFKFDAEEEIGK